MDNRINQGKQTELVKRSIINYIADFGLKTGDRLPTQLEFRAKLGVGNAVIGRAIKSLVNDGYLTGRGRTGIFVKDACVEGYEGRNIGLICHRNTEYTSMAVMMQALSISLNKRACNLRIFVKNTDEPKDSFSIDEFTGLVRAINQHQIDGIISTMLLDDEAVDFCHKANVPLCYAGVSKPNAPGVMLSFNLPGLLEKLAARGFRRPLLFINGHPDTERNRRDFLGCAKLFDFGKLNPEDYCLFVRKDGTTPGGLVENMPRIQEMARKICAMKPAERPDVLLVPDDVLALWVWLVIQEGDWRPELVHFEIKQMVHSCPLRKFGPYFQMDMMKFTELVTDTIVGMARDGVCDVPSLEYVCPLIDRKKAEQA